MYTATVKAPGKPEVTHNLTQTQHKRARSEALDLLPDHDGAAVKVERNGLFVGLWECFDGGRAVWSVGEDD